MSSVYSESFVDECNSNNANFIVPSIYVLVICIWHRNNSINHLDAAFSGPSLFLRLSQIVFLYDLFRICHASCDGIVVFRLVVFPEKFLDRIWGERAGLIGKLAPRQSACVDLGIIDVENLSNWPCKLIQ